ncbi:MAG TPA: lysyl oxidase family protein [Polyangiaceae bacterium]
MRRASWFGVSVCLAGFIACSESGNEQSVGAGEIDRRPAFGGREGDGNPQPEGGVSNPLPNDAVGGASAAGRRGTAHAGESSSSSAGDASLAPTPEPSGAGGSSSSAVAQGGGIIRSTPLPDLVVDEEYLRETVYEDSVDASADVCLFHEGCVSGHGMRRVIRFATRSGNIGTADVRVDQPSHANPLWEFDACHDHFHFEGYAHYRLREVSSGAVLPMGVKNGFCLRDNGPWSSEFEGNDCARYDCDTQGIGAGCSDVYEADLDCQWIDITGVASGTYDVVVTINEERLIEELDYANNAASVRVEISVESIRVLPAE